MRLVIDWSNVTAVTSGSATRLAASMFEIDLEGLRTELERDSRFASMRLAVPAEHYRIMVDWVLAGEPGGLVPLGATEAGATRPGGT